MSLAEPLGSPKIVDLDNDTQIEVLATWSENEIWVFDHRFRVRQRHRVGVRISSSTVIPDVDGDGIAEITGDATDGGLLFGPDLSVKATFADGTIGQVMRRGAGVPPYLIGNRKGKLIALRLVRNRWYLFNRYGPYALGALGLGAALAAGMAGASLWRRTRLLQSIQALALDTEDRGMLLLDPNGRVQMTNATFRRWFGLDGSRPLQHVHFKEALTGAPDLVTVLRTLLTPPIYHHEQPLSIDLNGSSRQLRVIADPLPSGRKNAPYWLVRVEDRSQDANAQQAQAWTMMAQRVAHDIKNPLTSILLTLQQLQMAYRERVPEQGTAFDPYVDRIIDRIESLRRMTHNFMKFMNAEKPNLAMTDLNAFVEEVSTVIRQGLPSDIDLQLNLSPNLPGIRLDRESMQSVLENLVTNAINAMPDGGRITIATSLAQNLPRLSRAGTPEPGLQAQDYAVIEVRDTGFGIPAWAQQRLFDLGFTTRERGSGLGLTLAKKIVEDHGGYVEVESEEGVGSVFEVYVPV